MELSLASVAGDSSFGMLTPEHEAKSGDGDRVNQRANTPEQ